ncbi:nose resistant to fluoxetine protein 6-like [Venturia canescens]|uniref:nose resistant to fluoxetine protein 6-like n=1 Tax=Venturia canescens TaxID=32260 RepID=UPI001C9CF97E|nr:nose resistant to fluoxetine protein 6-like [Venturia canescens]
MRVRCATKLSRVRPLLRIFSTLILHSLVLLGSGESSQLPTRENSERPETTLLKFFSRSFEPQDGTVGPECMRDSIFYRNALDNYEPWALQMYDASTKIASGLVTGSTKQLGNYDECLRVKTDYGFVGKACSAKVQFVISPDNSNNNDDDGFNMEHLLLNVALASGLKNWTSGSSAPYEWLWCVPSSCSPRDVAETIEIGLDSLKRPPRVDFSVDVGNKSCHTLQSDHLVLDIADWLYISLLILFGSLVAISTLYDLVKQSNPEKPASKEIKSAILCSFSAYTNGKGLLDVRRGSGTIPCLDGLRFFSICWIVYGHTHYLKIVGANLDLLSVATLHERWDSFLLLNGNIATDTFFLLSGILLAYTELMKQEKYFGRQKLNIFGLYARRYLRLTPAYAVIIGFYATLFYKMGSGPYWDTWIDSNRNFCRENWWTNLLYVNNYVNVQKMCMSQSWYLSVDMQLVWIAPIFLYPMLKPGRKSQLIFLTLLSSAFLASILAPLFITYFNELTGTMIYYKKQLDVANVYLQIYTRAYARAAPYLLGLGVGYLLRKIKPTNTSISTSVVIGGWIFAIVAGLAVVFGPRAMYFPEHEYDALEAAFYAGFHRPVFALAVSWIVVASVFDRAGPVGALLSWSVWVPLSKLTYSIYLSHYIILLYNSASVRTPGNLTTIGVVQAFFGNLAMTVIISVMLSLTFEIPFIRLTSLLFKNDRPLPSAPSKPIISAFETSDSILQIYRASNEAPSTVSRTYEDLMDRYDKVDCAVDGRSTSPGEPSSSSAASFEFNLSRSDNDIFITSQQRRGHATKNSGGKSHFSNLGYEGD